MNRSIVSRRAIAVALVYASAQPAAAATMTATGSIAMNGGTAATQSGTPVDYGTAGTDLYMYGNGSGTNGFIHSYAFENGTLGNRSSGRGYYDVDSTSRLTGNYAGPAAGGLLVGSFHFEPLEATADATRFDAEWARATIGFEIKRDGVRYAWLDIAANVTDDGDDSNDFLTVDHGGFDLADLNLGPITGTGAFRSLYGSGGDVSIALGTIGAGEIFELDYLMYSTAEGFSLSQSTGGSGYGYGYGYGYGDPCGGGETVALLAIGSDSCISYGQAESIGRIGDPFEFGDPGSYNPDSFFTSRSSLTDPNPTLTPVPEPATLGLVGLGLAGMGLARRRKRA